MIKKAFSLAEMMVVMLILSIILAAAMPIITKRVVASNSEDGSGSELWHVTSNSKDIYYGTDAKHRVSIGTSDAPSTDSILTLNTGSTSQNQMTFKVVGTEKGKLIVNSSGDVGLGNVTVSNSSTAVGSDTKSIGQFSTALGPSSMATGDSSIAIGYSAHATGGWSVAIGEQTQAIGDLSIVIGDNAKAESNNCTALGPNAKAAAISSTALGYDSNATGNNSTALGYNSIASGDYSTALGYGSNAIEQAGTALGFNSNASGFSSSALGFLSNASATASTALGYCSNAIGVSDTALGDSANAAATFSTALGPSSSATSNYSTALGYNAKTTTSNQIMLGTSGERVDIPGSLYVNNIKITSDKRLKNINGDFSDGLEKIRKIKPIKYTLKNDKKKILRVGVIAQDLQKIFPNAVSKDKNDPKGYLSIRTDDMFYAMINSIQQLDHNIQITLGNINSIVKHLMLIDNKIKLLELENKKLQDTINLIEIQINNQKAF